jgi:phosphate transport system permease protein
MGVNYMDDNIKVRETIQKNISNKKNRLDRLMPGFFLVMSSISIITTIGILLTLIVDASKFFAAVPLSLT